MRAEVLGSQRLVWTALEIGDASWQVGCGYSLWGRVFYRPLAHRRRLSRTGRRALPKAVSGVARPNGSSAPFARKKTDSVSSEVSASGGSTQWRGPDATTRPSHWHTTVNSVTRSTT